MVYILLTAVLLLTKTYILKIPYFVSKIGLLLIADKHRAKMCLVWAGSIIPSSQHLQINQNVKINVLDWIGYLKIKWICRLIVSINENHFRLSYKILLISRNYYLAVE